MDWVSSNDYDPRCGVTLYAFPNGLHISGWYDSFVGIEGGFISWEEVDALRKRARRRKPFVRSEE